MNHLLQLFPRNAFFLSRWFLINETHVFDYIARIEKQQALARKPIASGTSGFLIVTFDILGQIVMSDKAHIGLIDSHAKGDGGADHSQLVAQEQLLMPGALLRGKTGVIRFCGDAGRFELQCQRFGRFAALAIDNPIFIAPLLNPLDQLRCPRILGNNSIGDVGPVKTGNIELRIAKAQLGQYILPHPFGGRGCQSEHRHLWDLVAQGG